MAAFVPNPPSARFARAFERNVVKIDPTVPLEIMGPLGCGTGTVMNTLRPKAGTSMATFGAGSIGLSAVMAAKVVGCTIIIAVDLNENRLALATELGATHVFNGGKVDAVAEILALTDGLGAHNAIGTTGAPKVFRQAVEAVLVTGSCALVGVAPLGTDVTFDMNAIRYGRTIKGVVIGDSVPEIFIPQLMPLWKQGRSPFDRLIKYYELSKTNEACAALEDGSVFKPVLRPQGLTWSMARRDGSAKLNGRNSHAYLTDVLERIIAGRTKITEIEDLLPWNWQPAAVAPLQAAA